MVSGALTRRLTRREAARFHSALIADDALIVERFRQHATFVAPFSAETAAFFALLADLAQLRLEAIYR